MALEALDFDILNQIASGNNTRRGIIDELSIKYEHIAEGRYPPIAVSQLIENRLKLLRVNGLIKSIQRRRMVLAGDGRRTKAKIQKMWAIVKRANLERQDV